MEVRLTSRAAAIFERVSKVYPGHWGRRRIVALDDVSVTIPWGSVFGLIGPNRAGKTTLVKILLSICRPTRGRIMRIGCPLSDRSTLAAVGYVHENPSFPRYLTATQLLEGYGRLSGLSRSRVRFTGSELLERVGLADRSREKIASFSKGMLQRLALAQALMNDPKLLVLDEPSEGMDLSARRLLQEIIRERSAAGHSVILVSHALADVEKLCDHVAVLRGGKVAFSGLLTELPSYETDSENGSSLEDALAPIYEGALA